jgi:putative DNA primase/helicase
VSWREVKDAARGQWKQTLISLGVDTDFLTGKHTPCPGCGGKDRFRFTDYKQEGSYICNVCGAGDGFALLSMVNEWSRPQAISEVGKHLNIEGSPREQGRERQDPAIPLRNALKGCSRDRSPLKEYLKRRGLSCCPRPLRYNPSLPYYDDDSKFVGKFPAMLAVVHDKNGANGSVHRTYLTDRVHKRKKMMASMTQAGLGGGAVRLWPVHGDELAVCEGIETAIAVHELAAEKGRHYPVWATLGTSLMSSFCPPEGVRKLLICGDHDENYAGHEAAYKLAHRMRSGRFKDQIEEVTVVFPTQVGDWLDVLNRGRRDD